MDLSQLSDEQLSQLAQEKGIKLAAQNHDLSSLSDEQLQSLAESKGIKPESIIQKDSSILQKGLEYAQGLPQGWGNKFVGAVQTGTDIIAPESQFARNLGKQVGKLKERQSKLSPAEKAGIFTTEIAADLALSPTKGLGIVGQGVASGVTSALTTPLEESGPSNRIRETLKSGVVGGLLGKTFDIGSDLVGIAKEGAENLGKGIKARVPEELKAVGQQLKEKASSLYEAVKESGAVLRPEATQRIIKNIEESLVKNGEKVTPHLHGDTLKTLEVIKKDILKNGGSISLPELDQYRQLLNQTIKKNTSKLDGANPDAFKAIVAKDALDNALTTLKPEFLIKSGNPEALKLLNEARGEWGRAAKFERISDIVEKADGDPNRIKSLLGTFVKNKNNFKGFKAEEINALKEAARSTGGEKALKMLGKFGIDFEKSLTGSDTVLPVAELYFGGLKTGTASVVAGTAAKQAQKYIARGKLDDALKVIESHPNQAQVISKIPNQKIREKAIAEILTRRSSVIASQLINNNPSQQ